jgi:hypothetical protein
MASRNFPTERDPRNSDPKRDMGVSIWRLGRFCPTLHELAKASSHPGAMLALARDRGAGFFDLPYITRDFGRLGNSNPRIEAAIP